MWYLIVYERFGMIGNYQVDKLYGPWDQREEAQKVAEEKLGPRTRWKIIANSGEPE